MAEHARIIDAGRGHYVTANHPGNATDVAVPADEYAALVRARDILANPERLAGDIYDAIFYIDGDYTYADAAAYAAIFKCLRRAAADSGAVDDGPVQH